MISFARFAMVGTMTLMAGMLAGAVQAQTASAGSRSEGRVYAEVAIGSTFGQVSARSVGGEAGVRLAGAVEVFVEGGRMDNVDTAELDARAQTIATFIRGSASAVQKADFFDAGVKYRFPMGGMVRPYIGVGAGLAKVTRQVSFTVNGTDVTSQLSGDPYRTELGTDLSDSVNKTFVMVAFGAQAVIAHHFVVDGSYRYGRILPKTSVIDGDVAITAQRVQIGVGVRF